MVNEWTRDDLPKQRPMIEMYADAYRDESNVRPPMALVLDAVVEHLNRAHPKPAREVDRKDLPDFGAMGSVMARWKVSYGAVSDVLDAVVEHLNANGGLPTDDRWCRAHAIVEQERDQARSERDIWAKSAHEFRDIVETAERERDEWKARAEAAEKRHTWPKTTPSGHTYVAPDTYVALCHQHSNAAQAEVECWEADECPPEPTWEMVGIAHREVERIQRDYCECQEELVEASLERDQWMARAEARTVPAVTREDVEECVYGSRRAGRECDKQGFVPVHVQEAVGQLCDLFGVEAEQAVDPVTEKSRELAGVMHEAIKDERVEWHTAPAAVDVMAARLAAHVLGQEAKR